MGDAGKKKKTTLFTHWARPRVRTYEYNYEYSESYYRPLVRYISTSRALAQSSSSSSSSYQTSLQKSERRRRAASPPGALSFIERWSNEPFYGYGVGFRSRESVERSLASSSSTQMSSQLQSSSSLQQSMSSSLQRKSSAASALHEELMSCTSGQIRSRRARSVEATSRYASDDCLMRSTALERAASATRDIMDTHSLTQKTLSLDSRNILHGRTLDERFYLDYPKQHLVCPPNCPLHNNPEWRRRFLIGNRFLDAAALGGFDVLYDPTVLENSRRLIAKLASISESDTEEIMIQRSSESESSRMRMRAISVA